MPRDGGATVAAYGRAGIDVAALASQLQMQGAKSFDDSWQDLLDSMVWAIDSFDQWGVELGKILATRITKELQSGGVPSPAHDSSTNALIGAIAIGAADPRECASGPSLPSHWISSKTGNFAN